MTLFYTGPGAVITHQVFVAFSPRHQMFAISELSYIHVAQDLCGHGILGTRRMRLGSSGLAGVGAVTSIIGWPLLHHPAIAVIAVAITAASSVVSAACWRNAECAQELWAAYRGRLVCLYQDPDRHRFEQVTRGLKRVLERAADEEADDPQTVAVH